MTAARDASMSERIADLADFADLAENPRRTIQEKMHSKER
jgi:hypothetical protein